MSLAKGYSGGTHRAVSPETTLARVLPHLAAYGITRCADVTGLDNIGIATFCVVRPNARTVQVSNGKGLRTVDAKVSGLMEAIEVCHAENPQLAFRRDSIAGLRRAGERWVDPRDLDGFDLTLPFDDRWQIDWTESEELLGGDAKRVWLPASTVYYLPQRPLFEGWNSNGLASGNHATEATLHGIYELLERHTMSLLVDGASIRFRDVDVIELDTIDDPAITALVGQVRRAGLELVLLRPRTESHVHTFMAVLCDARPLGLGVRIDPGYGAHLDPHVAAIRAITEAAQSRLTVIHGSREDLPETSYDDASHRAVYDFFVRFRPNASFRALENHSTPDLDDDFETVLAAVRKLGLPAVYRVILPSHVAGQEIAVVKVLIPGALFTFPF